MDVADKKGLDSPPGKIDYVSSGITGGLIQYFTPYPLPELLAGCLDYVSPDDAQSIAFPATAGICLAGCVSFRGGDGPDDKLASLFVDAISGRLSLNSIQSLVSLAENINARKIGIRSEMVYADAPIASLSSMVYAHHGKLQDLMASCAYALRGGYACGSYQAACAIGFFCLTAHPFSDGNGRWSRTVVAHGGGRGATLDSALCALFLQDHKNLLAKEIWPHSMRYGLRNYISLAFLYREHMHKTCAHVFQQSARICDLANNICGDEKLSFLVLKKLFSTGKLSSNGFKEKYRQKVAEFIGEIVFEKGIRESIEDGVSCRSLWEELSSNSLSFRF